MGPVKPLPDTLTVTAPFRVNAPGLVIAGVVVLAKLPKVNFRPRLPTVPKVTELAAGQTENAITSLEASLRETPGDPALLINLGTAYARAGRMNEARTAFREAIASEDRYRVELADGSWEDSRRVARLALESLDRTALAAK